MDELERMLRAESEAELPPTPDSRYTEAIVRRRMAAQVGLPATRFPAERFPAERFPAERTGADREAEGLPLLAGVGVMALLIGASLAVGRVPLWLAVFPVGTMFLIPLLLKRRESR